MSPSLQGSAPRMLVWGIGMALIPGGGKANLTQIFPVQILPGPLMFMASEHGDGIILKLIETGVGNFEGRVRKLKVSRWNWGASACIKTSLGNIFFLFTVTLCFRLCSAYHCKMTQILQRHF